MDLNEVDAWVVAQRRRVGRRMLVLGLLFMIPWTMVVGFATWRLEGTAPMRLSVMAGSLAVIGACLALAGIYSLVRARAGIEPAVPRAHVRSSGR